jgi:D-alanyl-D-alanine carboxypeptidase (penicillin-binding protein 5/6)
MPAIPKRGWWSIERPDFAKLAMYGSPEPNRRKTMMTRVTLALILLLGLLTPPANAATKHPHPAAAPAPAPADDDDGPPAKGKPGKTTAKPQVVADEGTVNAAGVPTIETQAQYALILDFNTGAVLLDKHADEPMFPSSMTKMMTAYIVFDKLQKGEMSLTDTFPVSENAWRKGGAVSDSSTMFLELHSRASVGDLIQGVVVQSGNDACITLAEGISGSEEAFVDEMNRRAKAMGMTHTHFHNSTGYPDPEHYSSAHDLAILAGHTILDHPEFYKYYSEIEFTYNGHRQGNRNPLLYRGIGADGLKTGHTEASGYGLTGSAIHDGRRVIMVVNGLPTMKARAAESERLMDWAFREFQDVELFKAGDIVDQAPVWLGEAKTVKLIAPQALTVTLPRRARQNMTVVASYNEPIPAPIKQGDIIGKLKISAPGMAPVEMPLAAGADVVKLGAFGRAAEALSYLLLGHTS